MSQDIEGLIPLKIGYAIPSWEGNIEDTMSGLGKLHLKDGEEENTCTGAGAPVVVAGVNDVKPPPKPRKVQKVRGRKTRAVVNRNGPKALNPNQRLITEMLGNDV